MRQHHPSVRVRRPSIHIAHVAAAGLAFCLGGLTGCSGIEKAAPKPQAARADRSFRIDIPQIMRGTIAADAVLMGYRPTIARGYGLVVGLDGTGSRDLPPSLRAHMLAEMARRGVGQQSSGNAHIKPETMLDSLNTAVVIVEAVVPPGAVGRHITYTKRLPGTHFDVRVYAHPHTGTTSLEGGRLYTTELRPAQPREVLPPTGSRQARAIAEASGPIFVNPFIEAAGKGSGRVNRKVGRIMNGGESTRDLPLKLRLAQPSHARAEVIQNSINTRFPQEPGQPDITARGESDETVKITVPTSFRDRPGDFVELLRHTTIRHTNVEAIAYAVQRYVERDPTAAYDAAWRWQALGQNALPITQQMYSHPEERPRLAALRAGANLNDALVTPHLIDMLVLERLDMKEEPAEGRPGDTEKEDDEEKLKDSPLTRQHAAELLGAMDLDPRIDMALRKLLNDPDIDVRLTAYEALIRRADPYMTRLSIDDHFVLDLVESDYPMIYITQVGRPRIALFGKDISLDRPLLVDAWSGRLMIKASRGDEKVEVYYRSPDGARSTIQRTSARLDDFIRFLGHRTTVERPEPGLGLSYAETVGALFQIWSQDYLPVDFKSEQDRVLAAILRQRNDETIEERPEFSDPDFEFLNPEGEAGAESNGLGGLDTVPSAPPIASRPD